MPHPAPLPAALTIVIRRGRKRTIFKKRGDDMKDRKSRKIKRYLAVFAGVGAVMLLFLLLGPPELLARSEAPIFCGGCHVMRGLPPAEREYGAALHLEIAGRHEGCAHFLFGHGAGTHQTDIAWSPGPAGQLHKVSQLHCGVYRPGAQVLGMPQKADA
jgi:hypothetical protein